MNRQIRSGDLQVSGGCLRCRGGVSPEFRSTRPFHGRMACGEDTRLYTPAIFVAKKTKAMRYGARAIRICPGVTLPYYASRFAANHFEN